jgi:hypothetical protein
MFLTRDQKCLCLLEDTAGELSPSAPSPLRGEGWGKNAPGEHYKGRPLDSPAVIHALVRTSAHENDLPHPYFHSSILEAGEPGGMLSHQIIDEVKLAAPPVGKSLQQEDGANRT